jgi:hypothetical protein
MSDVTRVYWKAKEDIENPPYISGYCGPDSVPSYGEVKETPIPTDISVTEEEDGTKVIMSPPIFGSSKAYRYVCRLSEYTIEKLLDDAELSIDSSMTTLVADGLDPGATRENWWWYASDDFRPLGYRKSTPITLKKKWKRGMMEVMLESHPHKEELLAKWDEQLQGYKSYVARRRKPATSAHRKQDGDLVVLPRAMHFQNSSVNQIFRYKLEKKSLRGRAKSGIYVGNTRFKTPHGPAMTFKDGTAPCDDLSVPIQVAMCLLAWSEAPRASSHAVMKGRQKFEPLFRRTFGELEKVVSQDYEGHEASKALDDLAAATVALHNFRASAPSKNAPKTEVEEAKYISNLIDETLKLITEGKRRLPKENEE